MGAHPFAVPWNQISSGKRYEDIVYQQQLGARLGALAAGLHVHVAVRGADRALAVYNALRGVMPLFTAVAGNAPFIVGRDSGLATVRPKLCDALPRQGVGPRFATWDDFERLVSWGERTGAVPDSSSFWWECRLNLRVGTVEIRAPDAQPHLTDTHAIIALAHATVAHLCDLYDAGEELQARETQLIQENRWRAARYGITGEIVDLERNRLVPTRDVLESLLTQVQHAANRHDATTGLVYARTLAERDPPKHAREIAARLGLDGLARHTADQTENPSA